MTNKIELRTILFDFFKAQNIRFNDAVLDDIIISEVAKMVGKDSNVINQIMNRAFHEKEIQAQTQIKAQAQANAELKKANIELQESLNLEIAKNREFSKTASKLGQMLDEPQAQSTARKVQQTEQQPKKPREKKATPNPTLADALRQLLEEAPNVEIPSGQRLRTKQRPKQEADIELGNIHITFVDPTEMESLHYKSEDECIMNKQEILGLLGEQGFEVVFMNR